MNVNKHIWYLRMVAVIAEASHATRLKVGALLEKDGNIISFGYNGTPSGFDNECEETLPLEEGLYTKREVLHAESNAIAKCARSTSSSQGSTLYLSTSPCFECSKLIIQAGIEAVYYSTLYRDISGIDLLMKAKINCKHLPI